MDSSAEDMEDRRLADLHKFAQNHPDHPMAPRLMEQVRRTELGKSKEGSWYLLLREQQLISARKAKRQSSGRQGAINKWDKSSSLELIAELKKFQETLMALSMRGIRVTSDSRWAAIAQNLPNRYGLEQAKFARSCKVHFLNLGRVYKEPRKNTKGEECLDAQLRQALDEYFELGGDNPASPPLRKGLGVKDSVREEENGKNGTTFKMSTMFAEKIKRGDKRTRISAAATTNIIFEKIINGGSPQQTTKKNLNHGKRWESPVFKSSDREGQRPARANEGPHEQDELGNPNRFDKDQREHPTMDSARLKRWESPVFNYSDGMGPGVAEANEDSLELEELGNPRGPDKLVNPITDSNATLKRWDTASSVRLLATMAKVGANAVDGWQTVASLLPNNDKLDLQEFMRSCKEHYRDLLRSYKKGKWKENPEHQRLADEVIFQLEKLLQSTRAMKKDSLNNKEVLHSERRGLASAAERSAVKPPFATPVMEKSNNELRVGTKTCEINKKINSSTIGKNHNKFMKTNSLLQNWKGLGHLPITISSESNDTNCKTVESDDDSETKRQDYRRLIKKRKE